MVSKREAYLTLFLFALAASCCFYFGCAEIYRRMGYSQIDADAEAQADRDAIIGAVVEGVAAGQQEDAEREAYIQAKLRAAKAGLWQALAAGIAALSGVVTTTFGFLFKRERKITAAVITGVEKNSGGEVKAAIQDAATSSGVETALHNRVKRLT